MKDPRLAAYLEGRIREELDPAQPLARDDAAARAIVEHALELVVRRPPDEQRVRVSNLELAGRERTVVDVLLPDQPFVVDTFRLALRRWKLRERLLLHRLLAIEREDDGSIVSLGPDAVRDVREVYLYAELPAISGERRDALARELEQVFCNLRWLVADHGRMLKRLRQHTADIEFSAGSDDAVGHAPDLRDFLCWIGDDNYIFFGYRWYDARRCDGAWEIRTDPGSGLGLMRHTGGSRFLEGRAADEIPELVRARLDDPRLVFFDKSRTASRIHRAGRLDCLSIKVLDENGEVRGFGRFIGLLRHRAIQTRASDMPILRRRRDRMLLAIGAEAGSHNYKAAIEAFDSLPLEFLFPFELEDVTRVVQRILRAADEGRVEIGVVPDPLNRSFFVSVIVARSSYDEALRQSVLDLLADKYDANYVDHRSSFVDEEVALIHFFCTSVHDVDLELLSELERDVRELATSWDERFEASLLERHPEEAAQRLAAEYGAALPAEYRATTRAAEACDDVERLERIRCGGETVELGQSADGARLKLYLGERPYLTDLLPILDNCGLRVLDATLTEVAGLADDPVWIVSFRLDAPEAGVHPRAIDVLRAVLTGQIEDGRLNRLVLGADLDWRQADLLRAYLAYAQQLGRAPQLRRAAAVLLRYPDATRALLDLFRARFDPDLPAERSDAERRAHLRLEVARGPVRSADEDRVFALLEELVLATVRTSFFMAQRAGDHVIVLKTAPRSLSQAPSPRPYAELFVHAADLSGVHLRCGPIARGGIRWSGRVGDFRTEVLGLVKTQQLKNGLIVPEGAKGGFVLKRSFPTPEAARREADRQYARFVACLLLLTDNRVGGTIVPPERVVRHDGDDPYLVVAADKGTAHLSDVANRVAERAGYWLGDAFASGGSDGYDHKAIGITARGAWVCARRHFLEIGLDIEGPFSMAGIGDMSGDVFGNGLLLARGARLLAAFNHRHVFIDPDPDPELAWAERRRLFELPGSGWADYDSARLSAGGGIYERDAKSIELSGEARTVLALDEPRVSGEELVRAVLRMPVDLLWNGGIGTYVKAADEDQAAVGDRTNDAVRVDARELRARVVVEAGNLGFTQRGRVEFALCGGRIQTDAIDNSAGVDLSDREVNLKVLLAGRGAAGLMSRDERNRTLRECGDQVAAAARLGNVTQSRCLSLDLARTAQDARRIDLAAEFLERHAGLDVALEGLPDGDALRSRRKDRGASYTRPELAVLLGYTKLLAKRELVASGALRQPGLDAALSGYFPDLVRERFAYEIAAHPLRDEITAMRLSNLVINQAGVTLVPELCGALPVSVAEVILAYYTVDRLLEAESLRLAIDAQSVPEALRLAAAQRVEAAVREAAREQLGLERRACLEPEEFERRSALVRSLREAVEATLDREERAQSERRIEELAGAGLDGALARQIERLSLVVRSLGVLSLAVESEVPIERVVELHTRIGLAARITWLAERLARPDRRDRWERIVAENLQLEVLEVQRTLTASLLEGDGSSAALVRFRGRHSAALARIEELAARVEREAPRGLAPLSVVAHHIRHLI